MFYPHFFPFWNVKRIISPLKWFMNYYRTGKDQIMWLNIILGPKLKVVVPIVLDFFKHVEIFISYERAYFSDQHTEI